MKPNMIDRLSRNIVQSVYAAFAILLLIITLLVIRSVVIDLYITPDTENSSYENIQCADAIHEVKQLFFDLFEDEEITPAEVGLWHEKWKEYHPEILHVCKDTKLNYIELVNKFDRYQNKTQKKLDDVYQLYHKSVIEIKNTPLR